ncbi:phage tail protein [Cupriavidus basilensis]|uniref:phage tail protein n=1 Tax=Cupriavidus basilensis TaxID=68895 RepID=UPI0005B818FF|nr:phage tail protein [Cupriavidus basilensis]
MTPTLGPLQNSWEANEVEAELKQVFLDLFATYLRGDERDLNVYGTAHLGSLDLLARSIKRDGLAVFGDDTNAVRYLYRAWHARNPKRGLTFLRTYLQLLWPDGWRVEQMWQDKSQSYPTKLVARGELGANPHDTHYLTSRITVSIDDDNETGVSIPRVLPALRSVMAARFVLDIEVLKRAGNTISVASGALTETFGFYDGQLLVGVPPPSPSQSDLSMLYTALDVGAKLPSAPDSLLPWYSWILAVPGWSSSWTASQQRDAITQRLAAFAPYLDELHTLVNVTLPQTFQ